jgi:hypothetical protein
MRCFFGLIAAVLFLTVGLGLGPGAGVCQGREISGGLYFGMTPPGMTPEVFAPGIISLSNRYEFGVAFSPNLDECVFGVTNANWNRFNLWYTRMTSDSTWSDPVAAPFQGTGDALTPSFSADGNHVYFTSSRPVYPPVNIWRADRNGSGWDSPVKLDPPVNSDFDEWGSSVTSDGTVYFTSQRPGGLGAGDVYRTVVLPDSTISVENLGPAINSESNEASLCVARDGSYLIFESDRAGGYGQADMYISYNHDGVWTAAQNLGPAINTGYFDDSPFISPDGMYFFFHRRQAFSTLEKTDIWWVDARAVFDSTLSGVKDPVKPRTGQMLLHNAPNPFYPSTKITYSVPSSGPVALKVFDVLGREVGNLVDRFQPAGTYSVDFSLAAGRGAGWGASTGACATGRGLVDPRSSSGIYFCTLQVGDQRLKTMKMTSIR